MLLEKKMGKYTGKSITRNPIGEKLIRVDYHGSKEVPTGTCHAILKAAGIGHSIEDCLYKAKWGMKEHVNLLEEQGLPIPPKNQNPKIIIQNEDVLITA